MPEQSLDERFRRYLAGELPPNEAETLEAELVEDDDLALRFENFARAQGAGVQGEFAPLPKDFTRDVKRRIHQRSGGRIFVEDIVSSRFIPWFLVGSFLLIVAVVVAGRMSPTDAEIVEEPTPAEASDALPGEVQTRVSAPQGMAETPVELVWEGDALPREATGAVEGGNILPMAYFASVPIATFREPRAEIYPRIIEQFGESRVEEFDGYVGVRVRVREIGEAVQRLANLGATITEETLEIQHEERDNPVIRVKMR